MTVTDEWHVALVDGFSVLLGRAVDGDAAEYAVYYSCDDLADDLFAKGFDVGALGEVVRPSFSSVPVLGTLLEEWDLIAPYWSIDLGRSKFRAAVEGDGADAGVPELDAGVTGAELGRILRERGLEPRDVRDAYPEVEFRVDTDGSLAGALAAATGAMRGPGHLFALSPDWGVDPVWDERLAAVRHPGLRDHLRHLCRTADSARATGAFFLGARDPGFAAPRTVVAAWRTGEGQSWTAVVPE
ncbi:hypothetical protein [Paractinoplanes atraurantiacus]|uniref:Uncharacterized protein n=1 Tax=Paractinoplanes atraurantiacus TaxID=1036182 RepID=A0A285J484_9ACTN|nr:hypothetical protein [Actinoplanes atraurantiacus]SNY55094.1 hypothetical protein SAMN05421748_11636 [Actinoplanes atraurantiacus]